jgi:hypothetical protein
MSTTNTSTPPTPSTAQILCAGCLEWFPISALKAHKGFPYCVACFPKGAR